MKKLLFALLCAWGIIPLCASDRPSALPLGSEERYWQFVQDNTTSIDIDVKNHEGETWGYLSPGTVRTPYTPSDGPIQEVMRSLFREVVEAVFAAYSDEELRRYDRFSSFIVCRGPNHQYAFYLNTYSYTLVEGGEGLEIPESVLNPAFLLDRASIPLVNLGVRRAEIVIRRGEEIERITSRSSGTNGLHLIVNTTANRVSIPCRQVVAGNEGELILYYSDDSDKQVFDLRTGRLLQLELKIVPLQVAASGGDGTASGGMQITIEHTGGQPFALECSDDLATWRTLQTFSSPEETEVFRDAEAATLRFYRVRTDP